MSYMDNELVTFPEWGDARYRDSGEGGLFVMLFVPEPEDWNHGCFVDVTIQANSPDVLVHPRRVGLWEDRNYNDPDTHWRLQQQVCDLLREGEKKGEPNPMWRWAATARSPEDMSTPMLVAMHLGSTPASLWNEQQGHYWHAALEDLTTDGQVLYNALEVAYGIKPILATFLDT